MADFTDMEKAALRAIFAETPPLCAGLESQLERATVTRRENSGGGFFTDIAVSEDAPRVQSPEVLGHATNARATGLEHGLGFILFMGDGKLQLLEGFTWGAESTASLELDNLSFEIFNEPPQSPDRHN